MSSGRGGAPSRSQQAFSWLLSGDDDGPSSRGQQPNRRQGSNSSGSGSSRAGGRRRSSGGGGGASASGRTPFIPGFQLREDAEAAERAATSGASGASAADVSASGSPSGLASLQEVFSGVLPPDLIADVFASCGRDAAAAMDALLTMSGGGGGAGGEPSPPAPAPVGETSAPTEAAAAEAAPDVPREPCYLDLVPAEIKQLILEMLSLRDLARAARTCREFATYVRQQRAGLRTAVVPEGVSYTAVRGLVAAFAAAPGVSLSRCAPQLRFQHEFEDMLAAVALGEGDRSSGVPVSHVSLARCGRATDAVIATLCDTFTGLRRLDLTRCVEISDAGMVRLAAYTRQDAADAEEGEEGQEFADSDEEVEAAAAAAAMESMQLSGRAAGSPQGGGKPEAAAPAAAAAATPTTPTAAGPPAPAMESPDSAVRRIAAQRHESMMARTASAAKAQHGRPLARGLEELCLKETSVSARGTKLLLQPGSATSKSLKVLDVSRCPNLGGDALDLHPRAALEVLRASGCNALRSIVIQLPSEAPLRTLQLDSCRQLHEVVLVAHKLESLSFSHCGQLRSISLRCRRLRQLLAVNCSNLSLAASELHCPALEEVNLFGARQLDAEGLEAAAPSLTKCTRLDLTGCTSLPRLLLPEATALRTVSVAGCSLLRQVLLASPALSELKATGCSRLMEVRLGTASLSGLDLENCTHLREVQLTEAAASPAPLLSNSRPGSQQQGQHASTSGPKRSLVLRGCTSLPDAVKKRLREAVLGS